MELALTSVDADEAADDVRAITITPFGADWLARVSALAGALRAVDGDRDGDGA